MPFLLGVVRPLGSDPIGELNCFRCSSWEYCYACFAKDGKLPPKRSSQDEPESPTAAFAASCRQDFSIFIVIIWLFLARISSVGWHELRRRDDVTTLLGGAAATLVAGTDVAVLQVKMFTWRELR
jgi:hypothetical protein